MTRRTVSPGQAARVAARIAGRRSRRFCGRGLARASRTKVVRGQAQPAAHGGGAQRASAGVGSKGAKSMPFQAVRTGTGRSRGADVRLDGLRTGQEQRGVARPQRVESGGPAGARVVDRGDQRHSQGRQPRQLLAAQQVGVDEVGGEVERRPVRRLDPRRPAARRRTGRASPAAPGKGRASAGRGRPAASGRRASRGGGAGRWQRAPPRRAGDSSPPARRAGRRRCGRPAGRSGSPGAGRRRSRRAAPRAGESLRPGAEPGPRRRRRRGRR